VKIDKYVKSTKKKLKTEKLSSVWLCLLGISFGWQHKPELEAGEKMHVFLVLQIGHLNSLKSIKMFLQKA